MLMKYFNVIGSFAIGRLRSTSFGSPPLVVVPDVVFPDVVYVVESLDFFPPEQPESMAANRTIETTNATTRFMDFLLILYFPPFLFDSRNKLNTEQQQIFYIPVKSNSTNPVFFIQCSIHAAYYLYLLLYQFCYYQFLLSIIFSCYLYFLWYSISSKSRKTIINVSY